MSFFESDAPILSSSIKMAEDSDKALIRVYDLEGKETKCNISLFGKNIKIDLKPHAVTTVSEDGEELYFTENPKG